MVRFIENIVITIDVFLLLGSEIYLFWLIDWLINWLIRISFKKIECLFFAGIRI